MKRVALILLLVISMIQSNLALASHPNEGMLSLDNLIQEALANSPDIKSSEANLQATTFRYKSTFGAFSPELSLEGGPLTTKFDNESNSGTSAYGKAEWNLYRGGKDSAERSKREIEENLARRQLDQTKTKIAREVSRVFYEMAFTLESIAIKEKALELNQEQTKLAHTKKSAGFTSEADVIEFELREATIKSDIKELLQEKQSKSKELSVFLGRSEASNDLAVKGHLEKATQIPNKNKLIQTISDLNPDIIEAKANLESSKEDKATARSGFLPKIDLQAKYGKIANEEKVFSENNNYSVGLTVNIPLFSGFSSANELSVATAQVAHSEALVMKQSLSAKAEAETLFSQLATIQERLDLEEKTLSRSEQYYKITLGEYRRGVKNSPDMVGAAERLLNSRIRNLEFRRDFQINRLRLLAMVGAGPNDKSWFSASAASNSTAHEKTLAPGEVHEECMTLKATQSLIYSYRANFPLSFNIHYHEGKDVIFPVKKDNSKLHKDVFKATVKQDYCLMWTNTAKEPITISYEFQIE